VVALLITSTMLVSCSSGKLSEEKAKAAVNSLLAQGNSLPDGGGSVKLIEWLGLVQISENEMNAKANIQYQTHYKLNGSFIFHKAGDGKWVLDKVSFSGNMASWHGDVFQKVE